MYKIEFETISSPKYDVDSWYRKHAFKTYFVSRGWEVILKEF